MPRKEVLLIFPGFFQSKDTKIFRLIQEELSGFLDTICIDMPGHGESGGFFTFGSRNEERAFNLCLDYASRLYSRIAVLAFSLSALVSMNCLPVREVNSLILVSPPCDFSKIGLSFLSWRAVLLGLRSLDWHSGCLVGYPFLSKQRPIENIRLIRTPVLFLHGEKDPIVGKEHSLELAKVHGAENRVHIFKEGNHAEDLFRTHGESFLKEVKAWLDDTL